MARTFFLFIFLVLRLYGNTQEVKQYTSIHNALSDTSVFIVPEISTQQLKQILAAGSALLLDNRPHEEWANGHIPAAINVSPKPGMEMSLYTSDVNEILRLVKGDKNRLLVIYCNGPFCDKSKRLSADLVKEGFTNVVRYQLGTPVWRATGNVLQLEKPGLAYFNKDKTVVWVDARDEIANRKETLKGAVNIPFKRLTGIKNTGVIKDAKDDSRLPMHDHNTRIVVIADNIQEAASVAEAIAKEAFHNVCYFNGSFQEAKKIIDGVMLPGDLGQETTAEINTAWANLKAQLKRRTDIVANLVIVLSKAKNIDKHELNSTKKSAIDLFHYLDTLSFHDSLSVSVAAEKNSKLAGELAKAMHTVENDKKLNSDEQFQNLVSQLEGCENRIVIARRNYNDICIEKGRTDLRFGKDKVDKAPEIKF